RVAGLVQRGEVVVDAGDVGEAVDPVPGRGDDLVDRRLCGDVPGHGGDVEPGLGGRELGEALRGEVHGDHAAALEGDAGGGRRADAAGGAGDDHRLPGETSARRGGGGGLRLGQLSAVHGAHEVIDHGLRELSLAEGDQLLQRQR